MGIQDKRTNGGRENNDPRYFPKQFRGRRVRSDWQDDLQDEHVEPWHWSLILMFWCGVALLLFVVFKVFGFR